MKRPRIENGRIKGERETMEVADQEPLTTLCRKRLSDGKREGGDPSASAQYCMGRTREYGGVEKWTRVEECQLPFWITTLIKLKSGHSDGGPTLERKNGIGVHILGQGTGAVVREAKRGASVKRLREPSRQETAKKLLAGEGVRGNKDKGRSCGEHF